MLLMECPQYIWKEEALHLSSAIQSCPTLSYPMDCTPAFPVHQQHLGLVQIHVYGVGDAIQPCHLALTFGVWECAAGPLPCVPNYMHLESVSSLSWTLCCRIDWWDWVWLSQDMTHAEYAMGICYWTTVYRQFNDKLNVVLTIYSFLIYTNSMVALTYGILKAKVARFDSPPRSINFR